MKKASATIFLIIGSLAAFFTAAALVWKMFSISDIMTVIGIAALITLGFVSSRLAALFRKKYGFKKWQFVLSSYLSCVLGAIIYFFVMAALDSADVFGTAEGGSAAWTALGFVGMSLVYLISGTVFSLFGFKPNT